VGSSCGAVTAAVAATGATSDAELDAAAEKEEGLARCGPSDPCCMEPAAWDLEPAQPPQLTHPPTSLLCLNLDGLAAVMIRLPLHDVLCGLALTCHRLRAAAADDIRLWMPLCKARCV
jgi:hypothetical protein